MMAVDFGNSSTQQYWVECSSLLLAIWCLQTCMISLVYADILTT